VSWLRRVVLLAALPCGLWLGVLGAFHHLRAIGPVPSGALVAVVGLAVFVRAAALLTGRRRAAVLVLVGWLLATTLLAVVTPGGDIILTDLASTWVYLLGGVIALSTAATLPPLPLRELAAPVSSNVIDATALSPEPGRQLG
jgi:hypothetical protein